MAISRTQLIARVVEESELPRAVVERVFNQLLKIITDELTQGQEVRIYGFGTFLVRTRGARPGRNIHTGEALELPRMRVPGFRSSKTLREAVATGG